MKTMFRKPVIVLITAIFAGLMIVSCSDDDAPKADKTALQQAMTDAQAAVDQTTEGVLDGQYPTGSKALVQTAITAAQVVFDNAKVTQAQTDNAVVSLNMAVAEYQGKKILPIAQADLIAHWNFDEGTGTTAADKSANAYKGTLKTGPAAWGAGFPQWTADRYGNAAKALAFDDGANVEIPYNAALNPAQMTIALWINAAEINANNRFMGMQSWVAYKFQLQEANRPFMTIHSKDDKYYDRDAQVNLPINEWHHIAVTFGGGKMIFYIDGTAVKTWEDTPGEAVSISGKPFNLVLGQDFPTDKYATTTTNFDNDKVIPLEWGGFFHGKLDEMRMYKTVLTASQVKSIYDREKKP